MSYDHRWLETGAGLGLTRWARSASFVRETHLGRRLDIDPLQIELARIAHTGSSSSGSGSTSVDRPERRGSALMTIRGPLVKSYWSAVLLVVCALVPFLGLSSALGPLLPILGSDIHLSPQALSLTLGLANAAYALGTVLAVQLAVHYPQRRLLVGYSAMFTLGSVLSATAWTPGLFIAGHIIQGLFTSMMLIAAAPALVLGWPTKRLPTTAMVMNVGIFGAVALGPFIGGIQASAARLAPAVLDRLRRRRPGPAAVAADLRGLPRPGPRRAP